MSNKKPIIDRNRFKSLANLKDESNKSRFEIPATKENLIELVDVNLLSPAPENWNFYSPLKEDKLLEMTESIRQNGLMHPIVVWKRPQGYMILSGHNRVKAFKSLYEITKDKKYLQIPATVIDINQITDQEAQEIIIDTNWVQRQLSNYEKSKSISQKFIVLKANRQKGVKTRDQVAKYYGISGRTVQNYLSLSNLDKEIFSLLDQGKISVKLAVAISQKPKSLQKKIMDILKEFPDLKPKEVSKINEDDTIEDVKEILKSTREYEQISFKIPKSLKDEFLEMCENWLEEKKKPI